MTPIRRSERLLVQGHAPSLEGAWHSQHGRTPVNRLTQLVKGAAPGSIAAAEAHNVAGVPSAVLSATLPGSPLAAAAGLASEPTKA